MRCVIRMLVGLVLCCWLGLCQDVPTAEASPKPFHWTANLDSYTSIQPDSPHTSVSQLRAFDIHDNSPRLDLGSVTLDYSFRQLSAHLTRAMATTFA